MTRMTRGPFWKFPQPFYFETRAPLDGIIHELNQLNQAENGTIRYTMAVSPLDDGYSFHHLVEHRSRRRPNWEKVALGEGEVWRDATGLTTVAGFASIDPVVYLTLGLYLGIFITVDLLLMRSLSIFFVFFFFFAAGLLYNALHSRQQIVDRISEAVGQASRPSLIQTNETAEHAMPDESEAHVNHNSVWNDAISEYEKSAQE